MARSRPLPPRSHLGGEVLDQPGNGGYEVRGSLRVQDALGKNITASARGKHMSLARSVYIDLYLIVGKPLNLDASARKREKLRDLRLGIQQAGEDSGSGVDGFPRDRTGPVPVTSRAKLTKA